MNHVTLVGRLTRDVEVRFTQSGKKYAACTVAVTRNYKNANGDYESDFISCIVWNASADFLAKYAKKGTLIGLEGRLQTRTYEKEGQRHYVSEVVSNQVSILESKAAINQRAGEAGLSGFESIIHITDDDVPF